VRVYSTSVLSDRLSEHAHTTVDLFVLVTLDSCSSFVYDGSRGCSSFLPELALTYISVHMHTLYAYIYQ